jgi:glycerate 2-kinase
MPGPTGDRAISSAELLRQMFAAAVESAQPARCLPRCLGPRPSGRVTVIGAGKAAAAMAQALEAHWDGALSGVVVTRYGYGVACRHIEVIEAAHPIPDAAGLAATERILAAVHSLAPDDVVVALISGGGSALLVRPLPGLTLAEKQALTAALLRSGATIGEINCVRRHLSSVKGGRLAAACHPARVLTLAISDVPGDREFDIASGPTVADPTRSTDALAILQRYRLPLPPPILAALRDPQSESLKPGDARLARNAFRLVATPQRALEAAARVAQRHGIAALILGDSIEGEAREVARVMAAIALQVAAHGQPHPAPVVLLSGGETTVTVRGSGLGGRNAEFLLALAIALDGRAGIHALAADTDGIDGNAALAGGCLAPDSLARAAAAGLDARAHLDANDAHRFFQAIGASIATGPTCTNVNDFRAILIEQTR